MQKEWRKWKSSSERGSINRQDPLHDTNLFRSVFHPCAPPSRIIQGFPALTQIAIIAARISKTSSSQITAQTRNATATQPRKLTFDLRLPSFCLPAPHARTTLSKFVRVRDLYAVRFCAADEART